jgi:hypothetical protein
MITPVKRLIPLLLLLTACSTPPPPPPAPSPPPTTSAPASPDLTVTVGAADAAMGLRVQSLDLTNTSTEPHVVNGYPAITVLDAEQHPVDVDVIHGSGGISTIPGFDDPPTAITLKPGEKLTATLMWRNTVTRTDVKATRGDYLDVIATPDPPTTQRLHPQYPIDLGNTGKLGVSPWAPPRP